MAYFGSLLFYTALGSIVVLLLFSGIKKLQPWNKLATAIALTFLTLAWMGLPQSWRWVMSAWSPGAVLQGWFILDMQPALWQLGTVVGVLFAAMVWLEVPQKRSWISLSGVLLVIFLCTLWLLLLSGTLLMTLALWAVIDLVWCASTLMSGARSQRVLLATSVQGIVSVLLWSVTLFLLREGDSGIWWLLSPNDAVVTLLLVSVMIRTGVFGFQLVTPERSRNGSALSVIHVSGVLAGVILLFRVITLLDITIPAWSVLWPALSCVWYGFYAWNRQGVQSRLAVAMLALMSIVSVALLTRNEVSLAQNAAIWLAVYFLLLVQRSRDRDAVITNWPDWLVVLLLLGLPVSSIGTTYLTLLSSGPWLGRIGLTFGLVFSTTALLKEMQVKAKASHWIPLAHHKAVYLWPLLAILVCVFGLSRLSMQQTLPTEGLILSLGLWLISLILGGTLLYFDARTVKFRAAIQPVVDLLGLEWVYQAIWGGSEVLLGVVRVGADVVEGRGSMLWSVLILLLVMMILVG